MGIEENLKNLQIILPDPKDPVGAYVASKIINNILYIKSGSKDYPVGKIA